MRMKTPAFRIRRYRAWSYDVWGNARDGFDVNDRYDHGHVDIRCKRQVYNAGAAHEFAAYDPTDRQLSRAVGARGVEWDGESDYTLYATQRRNGRPICELEFIEYR